MPQQINLCTPNLLTQKRYFSAQTMAQALAVVLLLGGGLCAYWVWSIDSASEGFRKTLATQARELESLQAAIAQSKAGAAPVDANLTKDVQSRRAELVQRERLLQELQRGGFKPGWGHSSRLQLLAQTIPAPVWLTEVKADDTQLEVSGFTLDPAALSDWVAKLGTSPLLEGQKLTTVKVENVSVAATATVNAAGTSALPAASSALAATPRERWSFQLVSALAQRVGAAGGKP